MPNPADYNDRDSFMSDCVPEVEGEGKSHDEAVGQCMGMWNDRDASAKGIDVTEQMQAVVELATARGKDKPTGYSFKAAKRGAEVLIYGEIGDEMFGGLSAKAFAQDIKKAGKLDSITVRINSPGGSIFDGVAIYNTLRNHPAPVAVHVDGLAASAASVVAMAGDTIEMADNALMMIHEPWYMAVGSAGELRAIALSLDKIGEGMAATYAKRSGKSVGDARAWMEAETWFTAAEAREAGLADTIAEPMKVAAAWDVAAWRKRFRNPPEFEAAAEPAAPAGTPIKAYEDRLRSVQERMERLRA